MTNLIYIIIKFLIAIAVAVLASVAITLIFIIALPTVGWDKAKYIYKRVAR